MVKFATDVTAQKLRNAVSPPQLPPSPQIPGRDRVQDGRHDLTANDNFLRALGYALDEIQGRHHSMFVDEELNARARLPGILGRPECGEYQVAEYKRIGKGGKEVWIQATYNPIMDDSR